MNLVEASLLLHVQIHVLEDVRQVYLRSVLCVLSLRVFDVAFRSKAGTVKSQSAGRGLFVERRLQSCLRLRVLLLRPNIYYCKVILRKLISLLCIPKCPSYV